MRRLGLKALIRAKKSLPPSRHGRDIGTPPQTPVQSRKAQRKMADRRYRTQREGRQTVPLANLGLVQPRDRRHAMSRNANSEMVKEMLEKSRPPSD